jgi:hypothetical protein
VPEDDGIDREHGLAESQRSTSSHGAGVLYTGMPALAQDMSQASKDGVFGAMVKSLTGDVYGDPSRWRELSVGTFFSEGWDQAWVSPPAGGGGAPRQGWLKSFDGVFYRLAVGTYGHAHDFLDNGDQNSGVLQFYLPLNQRFEFRLDFPVVSHRGTTGADSETNFGDMQIVPRFLLSESRDPRNRLHRAPRRRRHAEPSRRQQSVLAHEQRPPLIVRDVAQ